MSEETKIESLSEIISLIASNLWSEMQGMPESAGKLYDQACLLSAAETEAKYPPLTDTWVSREEKSQVAREKTNFSVRRRDELCREMLAANGYSLKPYAQMTVSVGAVSAPSEKARNAFKW